MELNSSTLNLDIVGKIMLYFQDSSVRCISLVKIYKTGIIKFFFHGVIQIVEEEWFTPSKHFLLKGKETGL